MESSYIVVYIELSLCPPGPKAVMCYPSQAAVHVGRLQGGPPYPSTQFGVHIYKFPIKLHFRLVVLCLQTKKRSLNKIGYHSILWASTSSYSNDSGFWLLPAPKKSSSLGQFSTTCLSPKSSTKNTSSQKPQSLQAWVGTGRQPQPARRTKNDTARQAPTTQHPAPPWGWITF